MDLNEIDNKFFTILPLDMKQFKIPGDLICNKTNINTVNDEFACPICLNLLLNPKSCSKCEQLFCSDCIANCLQKKNNCPLCREVFAESKIARQLTNLLSNVLVQCPNNCRTKLLYSDLQDHLSRCQFTTLKIKCKSCSLEVSDTNNFSGIKTHIMECGDILINCDQTGCRAMFKRKMRNNHIEDCDYVIIKCQNCENSYTAMEYNDHTRKQCTDIIKFYFEEKLKEKDKIIQKLESQLANINANMDKRNSSNEGFSDKNNNLFSNKSMNGNNLTFRISIYLNPGNIIPLDVSGTDSISKIENKIIEKEKIYGSVLKLVHAGRQLERNFTVGYYNIMENATLHALISSK